MKNGRLLSNMGEMLIPLKIRNSLHSYLKKAGIMNVPYALFGITLIVSVAASIFLYIRFVLSFLAQNPIFLLVGSPLFFVLFVSAILLTVLILLWVYVDIKMFRRTVEIERVLPDFLEEVSVNLRAGMSFDKALWNSVESEYGVLEKEIEIVAKKVMTGEDTSEALKEFSSKYNSQILEESIDLLIIGIKSGGEISDLIDRVVENVKTATFLKKELVANVMSYVIFISLIAVIISPTLFALSYNLMLIIQGLGQKLASSGLDLGVEFGKELIKKQDFVNYSRVSIFFISAASSAIIADLREGSIKGGIKYVFFFTLIAFVVYNITLGVFTAIFGHMV